MQGSKKVKAFYFVQQDFGRRLKDIEILSSNNNVDWENLGQFVLQNYNGAQSVTLPSNKVFRYFKVVINSNHDSGGQMHPFLNSGCFNLK